MIHSANDNIARSACRVGRALIARQCASLHLPGTRRDGADPVKLRRQLARYGSSIEGMRPLEVKRGTDGGLVIYDGVTRATRVAKYLPETLITVEVTGNLNGPVGGLPTVGEKL